MFWGCFQMDKKVVSLLFLPGEWVLTFVCAYVLKSFLGVTEQDAVRVTMWGLCCPPGDLHAHLGNNNESLMSMILRRVHLLVRTSDSEGTARFQPGCQTLEMVLIFSRIFLGV